jgi:hypothetical protein
MSRYALGQPVRLTTTIADTAGNLIDPDGISLTLQLPDGTQTLYPAPVHQATGVYRQDIPASPDLAQLGHYQYKWVSTGVGAGVSVGDFDVYDPFEVSLLPLQDAKDALNIAQTTTGYDDEILAYLGAIEAGLEQITGGPIVTRTVTNEMVRVSADYRFLALRQRPVQTVTAITNVYSGTPISLADVIVDPNSGIVSRKLGLPFLTLFTPAFYVTYTAGWGTAVPAAFNAAARIIIQHLWSTQRGPGQAPIPRLDETILPGMAFAIPNRAVELLRPYTLEVYV